MANKVVKFDENLAVNYGRFYHPSATLLRHLDEDVLDVEMTLRGGTIFRGRWRASDGKKEESERKEFTLKTAYNEITLSYGIYEGNSGLALLTDHILAHVVDHNKNGMPIFGPNGSPALLVSDRGLNPWTAKSRRSGGCNPARKHKDRRGFRHDFAIDCWNISEDDEWATGLVSGIEVLVNRLGTHYGMRPRYDQERSLYGSSRMMLSFISRISPVAEAVQKHLGLTDAEESYLVSYLMDHFRDVNDQGEWNDYGIFPIADEKPGPGTIPSVFIR